MSESTIFTLAFILYIGSAFFYLAFLYSKREARARTGSAIALFGLLLHTLALILRTIQSGHAPFTNMYESLSFLAWATVLAYLVIEWKSKVRKPGAYLLLVVVGLMALASSPLMPKNAAPLVPALQSYWLWLHVSVTLLGEAFFAVAFITSLMYLRADAREKKGQAPKSALTAERLDSISYRAISVGSATWEASRDGHSHLLGTWSWDPKEVWSLITWFVFALYLHTRVVMGWKGRRSAAIAIIGFLAALFTYFGVNYLLAGLHSYV
jgi:cytochrome c-type biogenesis protein CcsB